MKFNLKINHLQESFYYQPNQYTMERKFFKSTTDLHCLNLPKIGNFITPDLKSTVFCNMDSSISKNANLQRSDWLVQNVAPIHKTIKSCNCQVYCKLGVAGFPLPVLVQCCHLPTEWAILDELSVRNFLSTAFSCRKLFPLQVERSKRDGSFWTRQAALFWEDHPS